MYSDPVCVMVFMLDNPDQIHDLAILKFARRQEIRKTNRSLCIDGKTDTSDAVNIPRWHRYLLANHKYALSLAGSK